MADLPAGWEVYHAVEATTETVVIPGDYKAHKSVGGTLIDIHAETLDDLAGVAAEWEKQYAEHQAAAPAETGPVDTVPVAAPEPVTAVPTEPAVVDATPVAEAAPAPAPAADGDQDDTGAA